MKVRIVSSPAGLEPSSPTDDLLDRPLSADDDARLARALRASRGDPAWRTRKAIELREVLALAALAERLAVLDIDARTDLDLTLELRVPVALRSRPAGAPPPSGDGFQTAPLARVRVRYTADLLRGPISGFAAVSVLEPRGVWHPNVSADAQQRLCLGASIPRGTPVRELILQTYAALALQALTLEDHDPAGALNGAAVRYWRERRALLPLTRDSILAPWSPIEDQARAARGEEPA